jgi:hypothetical protein
MNEIMNEQRISPHGTTSPPGDKNQLWAHSLPLGAKLRMGPWAVAGHKSLATANYLN